MAKKSELELLLEENRELRQQLGNLGNSAELLAQYHQVLQLADQMQRLLLEVRGHALPLGLARRIDEVLDEIRSLG